MKNPVGVIDPKIDTPADGDTFVRLNVADVAPETEAVTLKDPTVLFANGTGDVAMPELLVFTITEVAPLKVALAPLAGAVNVTGTPDSGFDEASVTFA